MLKVNQQKFSHFWENHPSSHANYMVWSGFSPYFSKVFYPPPAFTLNESSLKLGMVDFKCQKCFLIYKIIIKVYWKSYIINFWLGRACVPIFTCTVILIPTSWWGFIFTVNPMHVYPTLSHYILQTHLYRCNTEDTIHFKFHFFDFYWKH